MSELAAAQRHLRRADPVLAQIIDRCGSCTLQPDRRYFASLVEAILSQQLSVKAAATIHARFKDLLGGQVESAGILQLTDAQIRAAGISRQKMGYLRDLSTKWQDGLLHGRRLARLTDDEVIAALTQVKGIGRWTAEMFLIFSLGRLDVLPVDDLGFRNAVKKAYRLRKLPEAKRLQQIAENWRPYRSVATWYLWQSLDNKPR
ncbi:DNA-3-methyladenine glycosylase 2 family protein [candidate division KSB1 bacterium]|nr:DNA-3-methyladenine glycosylase [bacterium]NUM67710.1 DNA-3-methyladenine glycosylase 2 family protein [candidate division KSB1 bacterium]